MTTGLLPGPVENGGPRARPSAEFIPTGAFPFPLTGGPTESPYLTWLRNRSNYMATRGFLDYLRAVGVLVRGIVTNFLIFLPSLLLVSVALAYGHHWMLAHPYYLTMSALLLGALWIVVFAVMTPIFAVARYKRSLDTGSESSVAQRDLYERSFGVFVLALVALAALESLPWALEYLHDMIVLREFRWASGLATLATGVALFSGADKLLSLLGGLMKTVAMWLLGVVGLLVPLVVILYTTDFLVYGLPPSPAVMLSPLAVPALGVVAILVALTVGYKLGAFTGKESLAVGGMLVAATMLLIIVSAAALVARGARAEALDTLDVQLQPLKEVASSLDALPNRQDIPADITSLVDAFAAAHRRAIAEDAALMAERPSDAACEIVPRAWRDRSQGSLRDSLREAMTCWRDRAQHEADRAEWDSRYFSVRMPFVVLGHRLSTRSNESLAPLRHGIARLAHGGILEQIAAASGDDGVAALLRRHLVERLLRPARWNSAQDAPFPARAVAERFKRATTDAERRRDAIALASHRLQRSAVTDIAALVGEAALFRRVADKFASVPGRAETARLEGKAALARLLTHAEMVSLVFAEHGEPEAFNRAHRQWLVEDALPALPPGDADETTAENQREMRDTARVLADLAESSPMTHEGELSLAFYFGTRAAVVRTEEPPPSDGPTPIEAARAAGVRLARGALADLGVAALVVLAFTLDQPAELLARDAGQSADALSRLLATRGDALRTAHEEVRRDASESERLAAFLALERKPLRDLAADAFTTSSRNRTGDTPVDNYGARPDDVEGLKIYQWPDRLARKVVLASKALGHDTEALASLAREALVELVLDPESPISQTERDTILNEFGLFDPSLLGSGELAHIASASFWADDTNTAGDLITKVKFGRHGRLQVNGLSEAKRQLTEAVIAPKAIFVTLLAVVIWLGCWLTVDVNLTSAHGLYRDRLASAFLIRGNSNGEVTIEDDIDLDEMCQYDAGSTAPYHIINVALNLQGSADAGIRDRRSDFFMFSKRFVGGPRTGYCRSETLERVFPQMSVATAMAISAAAASPNMGRATSAPLVAFMTLLNIRLGYWMPNPGLLEDESKGGFAFDEVFAAELADISTRWERLYPLRERYRSETNRPTVDHGLVGIGFSGGGIRSASFNLGVTQALHARGAFDHIDYMSTVSGGGYLGSSISTLMRTQRQPGGGNARQDLVRRQGRLSDRFRWRVRPTAFLREMLSQLDETHRWVNVSDGGHIENLAGIELLRRRCRYIIIGDGEADPDLHFAGLATLIRCASLDLGIEIDIDLDRIRLRGRARSDGGRLSKAHCVTGTIRYPERDQQGRRHEGILLYVKSSFTGDEGVAIREYRHRQPAFPHQTTADQFFDEDQFEAYRALGQHIAESVLPAVGAAPMSFGEFEAWFQGLAAPKAATIQNALGV
jgi:hypothetical protein